MNEALAVTLTIDELDALVEKAVVRAIERHMPDADPILTREEAAELLGRHPDTMTRYCNKNGCPGRKVGRDWKFLRSSLLAWMSTAKIQSKGKR